MNENEKTSPGEIAPNYLRDNFAPNDRLAVVLIHKRAGAVLQRLAATERIAAEDFQAWLRLKNAGQNEIYISMNALRQDAHGRTKADVDVIRHVYLDFDDHGTEALERMLKRPDLPQPNYVLNSSPDKWQVIWKVEGFAKDQAENLQRCLARETGADPAATDCARVMRLPGFYNHKYARKHLIGVQTLSKEVYGPDRFPKFPADERTPRTLKGDASAPAGPTLSQSERDWAYAKRALARGEPENLIVTAIAVHRRFDKHNPRAYAELTVRKATESLNLGGNTSTPARDPQPDR
jgi:RepB DNA-primase N-terminal domain